jgi:hypothetical protein
MVDNPKVDGPKDDDAGDGLAMLGMAIFFAVVLCIRWLGSS